MSRVITDSGFTFQRGRAYTLIARAQCASLARMRDHRNTFDAMRANLVGTLTSRGMRIDVPSLDGEVGVFVDAVRARINLTPNDDIGIVSLGNLILYGLNYNAQLAPNAIAAVDLFIPYYSTPLLLAAFNSTYIVVDEATIAYGSSDAAPTAELAAVNFATRTASDDPARNGRSALVQTVTPDSGIGVSIAIVAIVAAIGLGLLAYSAGSFGKLIQAVKS